MADDDERTRLLAENQDLRALLEHALAQLAQVSERLAAAQTRIAALEQQPKLPPFVKPNKPAPQEPKPKRKKRAPEHNQGRRRMTPTRSVSHALDRCPTCDYLLQGDSLDYSREVIELPEPQPVEVIEHRIIKRFCPHCRPWHSPALDLTGQVLGHGRIGVRIASVVAFLAQSLRLPIRRIQAYLRVIHSLTISTGEVVELLHAVRRKLQAQVDALKTQARASPILHGDETGWRENGVNGYIWAFSTPGEDAVRYYEYDHSRGQAVVKRILDGHFAGHLVSDFSCGYTAYAGKHQRCWVHLLRDLHALKEQHGNAADGVAWAQDVRALYDDAQTWLHEQLEPSVAAREQQYVMLVSRAHALGLRYAQVKASPCRALAKRLLRHEDELFQFVLIAGLSADNNLAERSIRPLVVIRKISGGSRSAEGTKTRMALASLFETWQARGQNPLEACLNLLRHSATS
ncbi:MAG: IS66 family transposase [Roseiflexaceae bacterium]